MDQIEELEKIKTAWEAIVKAFRAKLERAKDEHGTQIFSKDGNALNAASATEINLLLNEGMKYRTYSTVERNSSTTHDVPLDLLSIDLSYLYISGDFTFRSYRAAGLLMRYSFPNMSITFKGSIFADGIDMDQTNVNGNINFDSVTICKKGIFTDIEFRCPITFRNSQFEPEAEFKKTRFVRDVEFANAIFEDDADFSNTLFDNSSNFNNAKFRRRATFAQAIFNEVNFSSASFSDELNYSNAEFKTKTKFSGTIFTKPPLFHKAQVHPDTSFHKAVFKSFLTEEDWRAYRTLKLIMGSFRAAEEEGRFFTYEQRTSCNLILKDNWFSITGNLSNLYDIISEYGENIVRPLVTLLLISLYFTACYYVTGGIVQANEKAVSWLTKIPPAVGFSIQNIFNPLGMFNKRAFLMVTSPMVATLSIIQSILTLSTVALLLLAIRRRFHKGNGQ